MMSYKIGNMEKRKILVKDLNPMLTCSLCEGYLIDATVLADCLHVFCRGCIIKYFDNCRTACPNCNILYKKKNQVCFRPDPQIQSLVYKLIPNLYSREMQTREDFYRSTGVRANSSCSDDSVIDKERDNLKDQEAWVTSNVGDKAEFFSPEDMISLSIEYYQAHLDTTSTEIKKENNEIVKYANGEPNRNSSELSDVKSDVKGEVNINKNGDLIKVNKDNQCDVKVDDEKPNGNSDSDGNSEHSDDGKRFLKCPAAVSMQLLQKFLRMKFGLTLDHRVDIIYQGEVLPNYFTLMDVAYSFKWSRTKPMRFFYRIFTPMKIKPIKIINTTSTSGSKQLQIVQIDETTKKETTEKPPPPKEFERPLTPKPLPPKDLRDDSEDQSYHKERLMAHLQLQSTHKKNQHKNNEKEKDKEKEKPKESEKEAVCIYEYVEPDKEEIKRFAEKRDREWALQKKLDEKNNSHNDHYFSKKRKKSKHSKNESVHKKRKLHAEITSNEEEDLKLKVKLTSHNSHKHKHHKNSQNHSDKNHELSTKEKLLQMRQVRHKHVSSEDKTVQTVPPNNSINKTKQSFVDKIQDKLKQIKEKAIEKKKEDIRSVRFVETGTSTSNINTTPEKKEPVKDNIVNEDKQKVNAGSPTKEIRTVVREWGNNNKTTASLKTEADKQNSFIKSFQSYTEKFNIDKIKQNKMEARQKLNAQQAILSLEKKINSMQQCTIEPKKIKTPPPAKVENKSTSEATAVYPAGFTVSKIEAGVKRKAENDGKMPDKRPSLEITLIPQTGQTLNRVNNEKVAQMRPLPSTIPLEKIRKSINLKSGISIIPKPSDICDNIGALDLSNKSPESSPKPTPTVTKTVNGINMVITNRTLNNIGQKSNTPSEKPTNQLSNLHMLSKVASEHTILNKIQVQNVLKSPRPNLSGLNAAQNSTSSTNSTTISPMNPKSNLSNLPNLTEIRKTQFKISAGAQIRSPRPNQNQNIRNIPNPSLLIRQQNQNRLNSMSANVEKDGVSVVPTSVSAKVNSIVEKKEIPV